MQLLEVPSGREIKSLSGRGDFIAGLAFSPDGRRLAAVGAGSGTVLVYDLTTGRETVYASGPDAAMDVAFNPDGTRLAVAGRLMVKLLDAATGEEALILRGVRQATYNTNGFNPRVRFSPDGKRIVAICHDSHESVSLWSIDEQRAENSAVQSISAAGSLTQPSPPAAGGEGRVRGAPERLAAARRRATGGHLNAETDLRLPRDRSELEFHLARLDSQELASAWEYLYRAAWHAALGNDDRADADLRLAFDRAPDDPHLWLERAAIFMEQGKWKQAAAAQQRALEIQPVDDPAAWRDHALLQLESGNVDGYRKACAKLVERYGNSTDPHLAMLVVATCTAAPDAGPDPKRLLEMLPPVQAQSEDGPSRHLRAARNAALYRSNDFADAARTITENEKVDSGSPFNAINWLFMAMTQQRLGHSAEAQAWLHKARGRIAEIRANHEPILTIITSWSGPYRLLLELLLREATSLVEPEKQSSDASAKPAGPEGVVRTVLSKGAANHSGRQTRDTPFEDSARATRPAEQMPPEIVLRDGLVIAPGGRFGRSAVHEDAVESLMVTGKWTTPKAGDTLTLPDGSSRPWEPITAGENATFQHRALAGGYLSCTVASDENCVMILDAAGHGMVYVNGEPRTGDPYSNGWVRVPVQLRAGTNDFLFHVARGQLRAKLVRPKATAQFDLADTTLPDLIVGRPVDVEAAVVVLNSTTGSLDRLAFEATLPGGDAVLTPLAAILPLASRKLPFRVAAPAIEAEAEIKVEIKLMRRAADADEWQSLDSATITLAAKSPAATHKRTFRSAIDGSVQYFAVVPEKKGSGVGVQGSGQRDQKSEIRDQKEEQPGLVLTLHGAGVEAIGQAACYSSKPGVVTVAPTNRRPFGFDWEDWGRLDAIEVLELAQKQFSTDPRRTYLTGHSMGGHGTWHVGVTYPDRFAAIGPSAGWVSMFSYAGARRSLPDDAASPAARMAELLNRCMTPSDTLALARNYQHHGVYVLHGEKDDNVPVGQARTMKEQLERFHHDFAYHEEPGQGHWWGKDLAEFNKDGLTWGTACVDWPPMFKFFEKHVTPERKHIRHLEFATASPGVSAWSHWVGIEAQIEQWKLSSVSLDCESKERRFTGTTENVAFLVLGIEHLSEDGPIHVELDGQTLPELPWPEAIRRLFFKRVGGKWMTSGEWPAKNSVRYGSFKDAFRRQVIFVYGTRGTPQENAWAFAKARYDAETFWYRGNGSVDVVPDTEFDAGEDPDRNVIIYGNAETNSAWKPLLAESPIQVGRSRVQLGDRVELGEDLGCLFIRPRPGSDVASVGVVSGTGVTGMRLTDRLPYFVSGVAYPDCFVFDSEILTKGLAGAHAAGFFGNDWSVASGEFVWRD